MVAHWEIDSYTVSFDSNGGTSVDDQTVDHGDVATEPTAPTREGYAFLGWYDAADGGSTWDFTTPVTEAVEVFAHWQLNAYNVTFDANGGSEVDDQVVDHGDVATEPNAPTRTGYTFLGWYDAADGGTTWDFDAEITEATTLYAQWELNSYAVTFDTTGGTTVAGQIVDHGGLVSTPSLRPAPATRSLGGSPRPRVARRGASARASSRERSRSTPTGRPCPWSTRRRPHPARPRSPRPPRPPRPRRRTATATV